MCVRERERERARERESERARESGRERERESEREKGILFKNNMTIKMRVSAAIPRPDAPLNPKP